MEKEKKSWLQKIKNLKFTWWQSVLIVIIGLALLMWGSSTIYNASREKSYKENYNKVKQESSSQYSNMSSNEMYNATRNLSKERKEELLDMFIKKWKADKEKGIFCKADNETTARYLFTL